MQNTQEERCQRTDWYTDVFSTYGVLYIVTPLKMGRDSSVGIEIRYGLDGPGIESRWWRVFPYQSRPALGPTRPLIQSVPGLYRG